MRQVNSFNWAIKTLVIVGDLLILNVLFISLFYLVAGKYFNDNFMNSLDYILALMNLCYVVCNAKAGEILQRRVVRPETMVRKALQNVVFFGVLFTALLAFSKLGHTSIRFFSLFYSLLLILLITFRLTSRWALKMYRRRGGNSRTVILVNCSNVSHIYTQLMGDRSSGFRVVGYFDDLCLGVFPSNIPFLGNSADVVEYLKDHNVEHVYYGFPSPHSELVPALINYCENNFIHFYSVPDMSTFFNRRMNFDTLGNIPIMSLYNEPLSLVENRLLKRLFDIAFSLLFLCTLFPIVYIVVGIAIKISSPGPILFKQLRSGLDGNEFYCYKFRSMRVNNDSDKVQATKNDPRKTRLGEFLRKSSIDELPQFINVLKGNMSVVGPRPHMLRHTEEYSMQINAYMVRHLIKPGVTGWAQVNGFRGETKELWQMEGRVKHDIWYLENWSFMLDLYIIYKTVKNAVRGEAAAY